MEPSKSKPNAKEVVDRKPVKEIAEKTVSLETKVSVKSAVDHLETHGLEAAPVTDPEGTLVGKISKDQMIRGVSGRGHDPKAMPLEREVEKGGEPYCYEHEPIAKAEEVMRQVKANAISVVSEEKKLIGKATRDAIEEERLIVGRMASTIEGGCLCGGVRYRLHVRPKQGSDCHCEDCRRASAAPYVTWCSVPSKAIEVLSGELRRVLYSDRLRSFASCCGTPLFIQDEASSEWIDVTVASLDDPKLFPPEVAIWTEDKLPWVKLDPSRRAFRRSRDENS